MARLIPTHEARCLVVLAGQVLERHIEERARGIAESRGASQVESEDVRAGATEVLRENLSQLPAIIEHELEGFEARNRSAA